LLIIHPALPLPDRAKLTYNSRLCQKNKNDNNAKAQNKPFSCEAVSDHRERKNPSSQSVQKSPLAAENPETEAEFI